MLSEVAEWLFQNVSKIVVDEAERQIREEAFPILPDSGKKERTNLNQRWPELPRPEDLITVHYIRWPKRWIWLPLCRIYDASKHILTEGKKRVHFYVATEDPRTVAAHSLPAPTRQGPLGCPFIMSKDHN